MSEPFDDLMRATNGAHVTVTARPTPWPGGGAPEVAEAGAPRRLVRVAAGLRGGGRLVLSELPADAATSTARWPSPGGSRAARAR